MAVRGETARDVQHEPARQGRHGRPRPFGGRLRLPTLRFSGAAMAMSTVVGISIATTLLLNEQQGIGRRAGVARVGTTPPPSPGATDQAEAASDRTTDTPAPPSGHPHGPKPPEHSSAHPSGPANAAATPPGGLRAGTAAPVTPSTGGQASTGHDPRSAAGTPANGTGTGGQPGTGASPSAQPSAPPPSFTPSTGQPGAGHAGAAQAGAAQAGAGQSPPSPGLQPTTPARPGPAFPAPGRPLPPPPVTDAPDGHAPGTGTPTTGAPAADAPTTDAPAADGSAPEADQALTGAGLTTADGRDGLRHALDVTVAEPVTALQAEFRLTPGQLAPGSGAAWTDLPGAVVTAQQERGTLVYRFTTSPGTDVEPGRYSFVVRGTRPADQAGPVRKPGPQETWNAAAFGIDHPRAVAALGGFGPLLPQSAQHLAHPPH